MARETKGDASASLLRADTRHPLQVFFSPRSVAVIGASERAGSVGRTVLWNLITNPFGGNSWVMSVRCRHTHGSTRTREDSASGKVLICFANACGSDS